MKIRAALLALAVFCGFAAEAFHPPVASSDDVTLRIEGLEQAPGVPKQRDRKNLRCRELDADRPVPLSFSLSNSTSKAVSGEFSVWMNDDWTVDGDRTERVSIAPGEVKRIARTARAGKRVLPALYPVHALLKLDGGGQLHPIAVFKAKTANRAFEKAELPLRSELQPGSYRLDHRFGRKVSVFVGGKSSAVKNPDRPDEVSRGFFRKTDPSGYVSRPGVEARRGFSCHPPYAKGTGEIASDFTFSTPPALPLKVKFFNILQYTSKGPNPGDGVTMRVLAKSAGESAFRELFCRDVVNDDRWTPGEVDLSAYAGKEMTLRLAVGVGAKGNSTFDGCAWGDVVVEVGDVPRASTEDDWARREKAALEKAAAALRGGGDPENGVYLLEDASVRYGAGYEPGPAGILDGVIAFSDGRSGVAFRGFECEIDGEKIGWLKSVPDARAVIRAEKGALRIAWDLKRAYKTRGGSPRFTYLACGPASEKPHRVYGGFGCVFERPGKFTLNGSGFTLSTRHAGVDYENGLSVVQAVDTPPIHFEVDSERKITRMAARNDTLFSFVPSSRGAFDAARRFAAVSGYRASPGIPKILGKMCLDDWSSQYAHEAEGLRLAAKYGLGGALYLQHSWQRWGYDYRLPEVYPPKGNFDDFQRMVAAAREGGFIFGIHDNYVDFYPDAKDFSYDHICFNDDGTPLEAWYNPGPRALSYRWLPQAIHPFLKANMELERDGFRPNALFIDVFTASLPKDVIDREGNFYPAVRNQMEWCKAFDECREVYGVADAVMVSEAGNDMLIGHVDAGQSDHFRPEKIVPDRTQFSEGERVPWHDIVTHGKMVLFGGGLGSRYSQPDWKSYTGDNELHGYGSDDYFCTTVIGGRSPMAGGAFGSIGVKTHWLLNEVCASFAKGEFLKFDFLDGVHRQRSVFSTGEVVVNRAAEDWNYGGETLPRYGFVAKAEGGVEAAVVSRGGVRCGYSKRPGVWFVDARAPLSDGIVAAAAAGPAGYEAVSALGGKLKLNWKTYSAIEPKYRTFCHLVPVDKPDTIAFHSGIVGITSEVRTRPGVHEGIYIDIKLPSNAAAGDYSVFFGMYDPNGKRLRLSGPSAGSYRVRAGTIRVERAGGKVSAISWRSDRSTARDRELGINVEGKMVDFGGIATSGAFRFEFPEPGWKASLKRLVKRGRKEWRITPLPGISKFKAEIDLSRFGGKGVKVKSVEAEDPIDATRTPSWRQEGDRVVFECDATAFAYRIIAK